MFGPNPGKEIIDDYELPEDIQETMKEVAETQDWFDEVRHDLFDEDWEDL